MINGVIFDMDGTMFDTERMWATFWDPALKALGLPYKEGLAEAARGTAGETTRNVVRSFYGPDCDADGIVESLHRVADEVFLSAPVPKKPGLDALLAWLDIRALGGEMLLRMEDLDPDRCKPAYLDQLADDLDWLGLDWDLGWQAGKVAYQQSHRTAQYEAAFETLAHRGLVYPCFCSRAQLHAASAPHTSDGNVIYPGTCRDLTPAQIAEKRRVKAPAYRLRVPDEVITFRDGCMGLHSENLLRDCGDFYLRRADGVFAYQLAVVVDDARMGVTEVVRGADLLSSTARQLYLYRLLGLQAPTFAHCPLLLAPDGRRLSKRDGDQSLENLRAKYTAEEIVGKLAYAYGLQEEPAPRTPESLVADFSWEKVPRHDICLPEGLF